MTDDVPVPVCKITTPHAHSSFDDPLVCPVRDAAEGRVRSAFCSPDAPQGVAPTETALPAVKGGNE